MGKDPEQFDLKAFRNRQKARNRALGVLLGALVVLFFAITIVKLGVQAEHRQSAQRPAGASHA
ncbi:MULTISPECIES: hypothetical protein [unclassified Novosphingobium]|uniref:hypothetical protein n=1 Tax=Novosphingobium TaxID=165696 RepID=UPI0018599B27|nr:MULTISPECIES: hypothetical protein [unclassified Novosphingobium]NKJ40561.1 hypothetical protein [Novosphingobium sp. SG720]NMN02857.1 hypothetical protein [Novosphingobium sp. SG919]NMN87156.1 hypothetical protein [Novosphingobium sp. SG916]